MSGAVFTIAGGKGGVGKTTTAVNTGVALQSAGHDTIIVDGDLGMTNFDEILDLRHEPRLHDVLAGEANLHDAIASGPEGLSILAGARSLEAFASGDPANLRPVLHSVAEKYDVVIVDTGAGVSHETLIPASMSDGVVLVTTPKEVSITDAGKMGEMVDSVDGTVLGGVVTMARDETDVSEITEQLGEEILAVVPWNPTDVGDEPVVETASESYAAQAYRSLAMKLTDAIETPVEQAATTSE
jgi:septum site-determining protein MinD